MKKLFLLFLLFCNCSKITNPAIVTETSTEKTIGHKKFYIGSLSQPVTSVCISSYDSILVQIKKDTTWIVPSYYVINDTVKMVSNEEACYLIILYFYKKDL